MLRNICQLLLIRKQILNHQAENINVVVNATEKNTDLLSTRRPKNNFPENNSTTSAVLSNNPDKTLFGLPH